MALEQNASSSKTPLQVCISVVCTQSVDRTIQFLESTHSAVKRLKLPPGSSFIWVFSLNSPAALESAEILHQTATKLFQNSDFRFVIHGNGFHEGFATSHNSVFKKHQSQLFWVLDESVRFRPETNLDNLFSCWTDVPAPGYEPTPRSTLRTTSQYKPDSRPRPESVAIAGPITGLRQFTSDGQQIRHQTLLGEKALRTLEGNFILIKSQAVSPDGLFAIDLPWDEFADADLCLRLQQQGYRLKAFDLIYDVSNSFSHSDPQQPRWQGVIETNRRRFTKRWERLLHRPEDLDGGQENHRFPDNRIFVDFISAGFGDVLAGLPTLMQLLTDHPTAVIDLQTNHHSLLDLFRHPRIQILSSPKILGEVRAQRLHYDRAFSLSQVDYTSPLYLGQQIALDAGVEFRPEASADWIRQVLGPSDRTAGLGEVDNGKKTAVLHAESLRETWEGRAVQPLIYKESVAWLQRNGFRVVLVGGPHPDANYQALGMSCDENLSGRISLIELFRLIASADLFLGIDSGPLHMAQLAQVPTFAIFGATLPKSKLIPQQKNHGYTHPRLDCLGCYHKSANGSNLCLRLDQACVKKLESAEVLQALETFLHHLRQRQQVPEVARAAIGLPAATLQVDIERQARTAKTASISELFQNSPFATLHLEYLKKLRSTLREQLRKSSLARLLHRKLLAMRGT